MLAPNKFLRGNLVGDRSALGEFEINKYVGKSILTTPSYY